MLINMVLQNVSDLQNRAANFHENVPPDWYARSIRENLLQRFWHMTRFREVGKLIEPIGGKVLDIGCADGTFSRVVLARSQAKKLVGIDVLPASVSYAKRRFARSKRMSFKVADAHDLPFQDKEFDMVVCLEALEHVEGPKRVFSEISRVLKDDGSLIVLVPTENFLFRFIVWPLWGLWRGKIWKGTHLNRFYGDRVVALIQEGGFDVSKNHKFLLGMLQAVKAKKVNR